MAVCDGVTLGFFVYVGVDGRCDDGSLAEEVLDKSQVNPLFEEHRCHGMAKHVGGDFAQTGRFGVVRQPGPDGLF